MKPVYIVIIALAALIIYWYTRNGSAAPGKTQVGFTAAGSGNAAGTTGAPVQSSTTPAAGQRTVRYAEQPVQVVGLKSTAAVQQTGNVPPPTLTIA